MTHAHHRTLTAIVTLLLFGISSHAMAQPGRSAGKGKGLKVGPIVGRLMSNRGVRMDTAGRRQAVGTEELALYSRLYAIDTESHPPTIRVWMRTSEEGRAGIEGRGIRLESVVGDLASAIVPIPLLARLNGVPGIEWIQTTTRLELELDVSVPSARGTALDLPWDTFGQGAVVGVVDSGLDWSHDDFLDSSGATRILAFWDQTDNCGTPPAGFSYGCYYTQADINAAIATPAGNNDAHGTHVTGTAAGDGSAAPGETFLGMAPKADIMAVKIFPDSGAPSCASCDGGDGLVFLINEAAAAGKALSVNMSFGSSFTTAGRDGSDSLEMLIDASTGPGIPGVVVSKSAGNNRGLPLHEEGSVAAGATTSHTWTVPAYTPVAGIFNDIQVFSIYYPPGESLTITVDGPGGGSVTASTGDGFVGFATVDGAIIIDDSVSPTALGDPWFYVEVDDQVAGLEPSPGTWTVSIRNNGAVGTIAYDMWTAFSSYGAGQLPGDWDSPVFSKLTSTPATAFNVTAVGAYVTKIAWVDDSGGNVSYTAPNPVGDIADFSSNGPSRKGRLKPEITAPGMGIGAALAADAVPFISPLRVLPGANRFIFEGTSFSSPHMTGGYARLLEVNPGLDAIQLRDIVMDTARTDGFTGGVPNNDWGEGKLDMSAAIRSVAKIISDFTADPDQVTFVSPAGWPGAASYNAYRASTSTLGAGSFGSCLFTGLAGPTFTDATAPPAGQAFAYLLTAVEGGIEGQAGLRTQDPDPAGVINLVPNLKPRSNSGLACAP